MSRVIINWEVQAVQYENRFILMPKYVLRVLDLLDYYAYDIRVFKEAVEKLINELRSKNYDDWPEWVKTHVPRRWANAFINHLMYVLEIDVY